jgi:hypothetical protein
MFTISARDFNNFRLRNMQLANLSKLEFRNRSKRSPAYRGLREERELAPRFVLGSEVHEQIATPQQRAGPLRPFDEQPDVRHAETIANSEKLDLVSRREPV